MKKLYLAVLLVFMLVPAWSATKEKVEIVVRQQESGTWQMFIFGPACIGKIKLTSEGNATQPIQVVCEK